MTESARSRGAPIVVLAVLSVFTLCHPAFIRATEGKDGDEEKTSPSGRGELKTLAQIEAASEKFEGLFTLYQNREDGSLYFVIRNEQLGKEYIYFTFTVDGVVGAGHFRGRFQRSKVFSIRKHFNDIEFVAENTAFYFDPKNALHRAANANISPAVFAVAEIVDSVGGGEAFIIKADSIVLSEAFTQVKPTPHPDTKPGASFSLGTLSSKKTKLRRVRNYPQNTDLTVEYVFEEPAPHHRGGDGVTDPRNVSIVLQHSLIEMPKNGYRPRFDDPRVGYFTNQVTDMTSTSATPYRDLVQRWHLVKKDPSARLSEPVEPIVWWIENTTPVELRDTIRDAALQWNRAFEVAGFKNALVVNVQPDDADWDAGDIRYNALRWTASPNPPFGGYGPRFTNPRTGQILGADVMLELVFLTNRVRYKGIFASPNERASRGDGPPDDPHVCSLASGLHAGALFGRYALQTRGGDKIEVDELLKSGLSMLILHELGHALGLNHNFKASHLHSPYGMHDRDRTSKTGLYGSVMDYVPVNVAPPGTTQGEYYTSTVGPYDIWAIEFGYSESVSAPEVEAARLKAILDRSTQPELLFGNDADDMRSPGKAIDPRAMIFDLSNDPIAYAQSRFELVNHTTSELKKKLTLDGESYQQLFNAFLVLSRERRNAATVVSRFVAGVYVDRAVAGQPGASHPFTPVGYDDQKRAMAVLEKHVFSPTAFDAPAEFYRHLQRQRRGFDFFDGPEDPKIHELALATQRSILEALLHPLVTRRMTNSALYGNEYRAPEFFKDLTDAIFAEDLERDSERSVNTFRRNLQLETVERLVRILPRKATSKYDATTQALAYSTLRDLEATLFREVAADSGTRAHRRYLRHVIQRALDGGESRNPGAMTK